MEILLFAVIVYFAPGITASIRGNPAAAGVWVLNIFLGWTLLGWVISLAWAFSSKRMATSAGSGGILLTGTELKNSDGTMRAEIIAHLAEGGRVTFTEDSSNPHDAGAIAVTAASGVIGYVPSDREALRQAIRCGDYAEATVASIGHSDGVPRVSISPIRRKPESFYEGFVWFFADGGAGKLAALGGAGAVVALLVYAANYQPEAATNTGGIPRASPETSSVQPVRPAPPPARVWREYNGRSQIDDTPVVTLTSRALGNPTGSYGRELDIRLVLRCSANTTNLMLQVDDYTGTDSTNVTFRIDNETAFRREMAPSTGRETLGLWTGRGAIPVIRDMFGGERLTVRYILPGEDPQTVRFNISNLETRIQRLRAACNW